MVAPGSVFGLVGLASHENWLLPDLRHHRACALSVSDKSRRLLLGEARRGCPRAASSCVATLS